VGNEDFAPTADFVTDRDVRFDAASMARRIKAAAKAYDECPAHHLAETNFGDAIYANMIMVGFAWQKGLIPLSSRALYRAIRLNGVAAEENLQAFELGRRVAHDPSQRGPAEADVPTPETMPLADLIAHRANELTAYQNASYARRYLDRVDRVAKAEAIFGSEALTRAVAISLYKLMAYKDEYEVARLYTDGRFATERAETFKGGTTKVWLSPPLIAPKGPDGRPKKIQFGGWMLDAAFPVLARLKGLRGGPLDIFGHSEERKMERRLIADYEAGLDRLVGELTAEKLPTAVKIAQVPQDVRGFGHIKEASAKKAKAEEAKLWRVWEAA
jgi:indolepyruvate ferredoxin oxidoreductase